MSTDRKLIARASYIYGNRNLRQGDPFTAGEKQAKILVKARRADYADEDQVDETSTTPAGYVTRDLKAEDAAPAKPKKRRGGKRKNRATPSDTEGNPDGPVASQFYGRRDLRAEGDE